MNKLYDSSDQEELLHIMIMKMLVIESKYVRVIFENSCADISRKFTRCRLRIGVFLCESPFRIQIETKVQALPSSRENHYYTLLAHLRTGIAWNYKVRSE